MRLDGKDWPLVLTHRVLLECDRVTGGNILADGIRLSARLARALLWAALARAGAVYSLKQVGFLITPQNTARIQDALFSAWLRAMPEREETPETEQESEEEVSVTLTWLDAWAIARFDLKLSDEEWLDMTPRQLHKLRERQILQMQREELLVGILASTTANFSMCHPTNPISPAVFMMHKLKQGPLKPVTSKDLVAAFAFAKVGSVLESIQ